MTTVIVALLLLFVLMGMAALAVDVGVFYTARTAAQRAADAAALAGAYAYVNGSPTRSDSQKKADATAAAQTVALQNSILGNPIIASELTIVPNITASAQTVEVTVARNINAFFAKAVPIGLSSVNVAVKATAEASRQPTGSSCLRPFWMPNNAISGGLDCTPAQNAPGGSRLIFDQNTRQVTQWAINAGNNGSAIDIWHETEGNGASQRELMDIGGNPNDISSWITTCGANLGLPPIKCGDTMNIFTGNKGGNVVQGTEDLIGGSTSSDTYVGPFDYIHNGQHTDTSDSVVTVAIWDCQQPVGNGSKAKVQVIGFAQMFAEQVTHPNTVKGRFITASSCGPGATGGGAGGSGASSIPVRLIQNQ